MSKLSSRVHKSCVSESPTFKIRFLPVLLAPAVISLLSGCGSGTAVDRPKTVPVSGVVTYKKEPLADAKVTFMPLSSTGIGAVGETNANGEYSLMTFEPNDGAVPGQFKVTVVKTQVESGEISENSMAPSTSETKFLIPEKYSVPRTSGMEADVKDGSDNKFDFNLE